MSVEDTFREDEDEAPRRRGRPPGSKNAQRAEEMSEIETLRAELAELKALLAQATLQKVITPPVTPLMLKRKEKQEPLIEMRVDDKGKGKISTGGMAGFERYEEYGVVFKTPESSGRHLWNRNYAMPVDRAIVPKWERENKREQTRALRDRQKIDHLLDEAHYDEGSKYGSSS